MNLYFIYVDGYAHTGEDRGKTLFDWYPKLKIGGLMAGDDYHDDWPLVKKVVNNFISQTSGELLLTEKRNKDSTYSCYPTWASIKKSNKKISLPKNLCTQEELSNSLDRYLEALERHYPAHTENQKCSLISRILVKVIDKIIDALNRIKRFII